VIHDPGGLPTNPDRRYWRRRANRRVRKARRTRTLLRWASVAAVNLAILGLLAFSGSRALRHLTTSPEFALSNLRVEGACDATTERVRSSLAQLEGRNLPELDLSWVTERVRQDPSVLSCTAKRVFPHTLRVTVTEREPWVRARIDGHGYLVDRTGTVIAPTEPDASVTLPVLTGLDRLTDAQRQSALERGAAAVTMLGEHAGEWVKTIRELDLSRTDRISVLTANSGTRVILDPGRVDRNLRQFIALEDDILDRIGPASYVDLRWSDRIAVMPTVQQRTAME
jgi:cell division protein FtsQ